MIDSSIKELQAISSELKEISHQVRNLPSNHQEGINLSVQLYALCSKINSIASNLDDDCK